MADKNPAARLVIIVEFPETPDRVSDIEPILDECRSLGTITRAELEYLKTSVVDLRHI